MTTTLTPDMTAALAIYVGQVIAQADQRNRNAVTLHDWQLAAVHNTDALRDLRDELYAAGVLSYR